MNMVGEWCSSHPAADADAAAAAYLTRRRLLSAIAATCRSSCVNSSGLWPPPINRSFGAASRPETEALSRVRISGITLDGSAAVYLF